MDFLEDGKSPIERKIYWDLWNKFSLVLAYTAAAAARSVLRALNWNDFFSWCSTHFFVSLSLERRVSFLQKKTQKNLQHMCTPNSTPFSITTLLFSHTKKIRLSFWTAFGQTTKKSSKALQFIGKKGKSLMLLSLSECKKRRNDQEMFQRSKWSSHGITDRQCWWTFKFEIDSEKESNC